MSFFHFFRILRNRSKSAARTHFRNRTNGRQEFRPQLENLEDRTLLSTNPTTHFLVQTPFAAQVGLPGLIRVTPLDDSNHIVTNYTGTVHFSSTDIAATLPADYTFTNRDYGYHNFRATFATVGSQTITATDTVTASITGSGVTTVIPAPVAITLLVETRHDAIVGKPTYIEVSALDASGHVVPNYSGTVHFTSSDAAATLPADYTFVATDRGEHIFSLTYATAGLQTVTATDTATATVKGSAVTTVAAAATNIVTSFRVETPVAAQAGAVVLVRVVPLDASNHVVNNYTGTVHFTSSDGGATLPTDYTFTNSDRGGHNFKVIFATPGAQTITATDTVTASITGSGVTKVVPAPAATVFSVITPITAQTGQQIGFYVVVLDASGHVFPNYTGTVHFTSSDAAATLPPDYQFALADHGEKKFSLTYATAGLQTVTATDTTTSTLTGSGVTSVTPAPVATHFGVFLATANAISTSNASALVGQVVSVGVVALDASGHVVPNYTGTVHFSSTDAAATLPADYQFTAADHGEHRFTMTFGTVGVQTVTATDTATATITGSAKISVTQAPVATHFAVFLASSNAGTSSTGVVTGQVVVVGVAALDASGHVVPNYTGTVHFSSTDAAAALPADYQFAAADNGQHRFTMTFGTVGVQTVTATDTATATITGSAKISVNPAPVATHFRVGAPQTALTGQPLTIEVVALDASGHAVLGYTGTVHFTSTDGGASLPADYQFTAADHGFHKFALKYATAGSQTVTATDTASSTITGSATTTVTVQTPTHFALLAFPAVNAGTAFNVIVVALDASNHVVTNYTGVVHFSSSDGAGTLPADYTFAASDNGQHVFSVTLATPGNQTVKVSDNNTPPLTGSATIFVF